VRHEDWEKVMAQNTAVGTALQLNLDSVRTVPFRPARDAVLLDPLRPLEPLSEEFGTLRTSLAQLKAERGIRTVLVTSSSPGEGKSFTAANLALAEAQLADNPTLLCDFDLRRPSLHRVFQIDRGPGISDYLLEKAELPEAIQRIGESSLFVMTAGEPVVNRLGLLHLERTRRLLEILSSRFRSVILDSPSLLAASDASLLATLADGTLLVARLGATKVEAMHRAIQWLSQNNVLGIVANGRRREQI
jgi:capsular exopolysaccharide synthesis family protein